MDDNKNAGGGPAGGPKGPQKLPDGGDGRRPSAGGGRPIFVWLLIIAAVFFGLRSMESFGPQREARLTYTQFLTLLGAAENAVSEAVVMQRGDGRAVMRGQVRDGAQLTAIAPAYSGSTHFSVNLPFLDSEMLRAWDAAGFPYKFEQEKMWGNVLVQVAIIVAISLIFYFLFIRNMQSAQRGMFSFGKSRAKLHNIDRPQVTFADAAGIEEAKAELEE
ncbi:MAG: hypothetical protein LBH93_08845, partial [Chitinispirillales bacterium]|nr:hypothetical protein [Chitinispirillales bacterium]